MDGGSVDSAASFTSSNSSGSSGGGSSRRTMIHQRKRSSSNDGGGLLENDGCQPLRQQQGTTCVKGGGSWSDGHTTGNGGNGIGNRRGTFLLLVSGVGLILFYSLSYVAVVERRSSPDDDAAASAAFGVAPPPPPEGGRIRVRPSPPSPPPQSSGGAPGDTVTTTTTAPKKKGGESGGESGGSEDNNNEKKKKKILGPPPTDLPREYVSTRAVTLLDEPVGYVSRVCPRIRIRGEGESSQPPRVAEAAGDPSLLTESTCWLFDPDPSLFGTSSPSNCNNNGPMPVRLRPWMHPSLLDGDGNNNRNKFVLYYSSHGKRKGGNDIELLVASNETDTWRMPTTTNNNSGFGGINNNATALLNLNFPPARTEQNKKRPDVLPCGSVHSPSVYVDEANRLMYMYVHGHQCGMKGQQTLLLVSKDGVDWTLPNPEHRPGDSKFIFESLFYLTVPVRNPGDGYYYALAKTQEDPVGSLQLARSRSLYGPWVEGPVLARGIRHCDMHLVDAPPAQRDAGEEGGRRPHFLVFATHIGDAPERVVAGTIDLSGGSDWMRWTLLPGPTIVEPVYAYEHGNATLEPSKCCSADCFVMNQLRDPHFLPDEDSGNDNVLSGLLFYVVQGERAFAAARISIDMNQYFETVSYRLRSNIDPKVLETSSLLREGEDNKPAARAAADTNISSSTALIAGVEMGSSSKRICTLFSRLGIEMSDDNCTSASSVHPGKDGAVSWSDSSYIASDPGHLRYDHIVQTVGNPLDEINSIVRKIQNQSDGQVEAWLQRLAGREEYKALNIQSFTSSEHAATSSPDDLYRFALMHWVRRSSFLQRHASWRERTEEILSDPYSAWRVCMASNFGNRCPNLIAIREAMETSSKNDDTLQLHSGMKGWSDLERLNRGDRNYVAIAELMARSYGYNVTGDNFNSMTYSCGFHEVKQNARSQWDCWLLGQD